MVSNGEARLCNPHISVRHLLSGLPLETPLRIPGCSLTSSAKYLALPAARAIHFVLLLTTDMASFIYLTIISTLLHKYVPGTLLGIGDILGPIRNSFGGIGDIMGPIRNNFCVDEAKSLVKAIDINQSHNKC